MLYSKTNSNENSEPKQKKTTKNTYVLYNITRTQVEKILYLWNTYNTLRNTH